MSTSIADLKERLRFETEYQQLPEEFSDDAYTGFIVDGIKRLYIDTARYSDFNKDKFLIQDCCDLVFEDDLPIDEEEYVLLCAKINFYNKAKSAVNAMFSYTTDALSVTNADKPYSNLKDTISDLEKRRRQLFYRMVRYSLG